MKTSVRILIVDDVELVRSRIRKYMLELVDCEVVGETSTAAEAITLSNELLPDVVILDIGLTGDKTGFDVLNELKHAHPQTTVAILTNYATEPYRLRAKELCADFFFDKSNEFEDLKKIFTRSSMKKQ